MNEYEATFKDGVDTLATLAKTLSDVADQARAEREHRTQEAAVYAWAAGMLDRAGWWLDNTRGEARHLSVARCRHIGNTWTVEVYTPTSGGSWCRAFSDFAVSP